MNRLHRLAFTTLTRLPPHHASIFTIRGKAFCGVHGAVRRVPVQGKREARLLEWLAAADWLSRRRGRAARGQGQVEVGDRPLHAATVRLIYRLALEGDGTSGVKPLGPAFAVLF